MPSFQKAFMETKGKPIIYKGQELVMADHIPVGKEFSGHMRVISTNSEWSQGVRLRVKKDKGNMTINGVEGHSFINWAEDVEGKEVRFKGISEDCELVVWNAWKSPSWTGKLTTDSWVHGAAMIVEINGNTRRYRCNDGHPDENFDDIIFEVTIDE